MAWWGRETKEKGKKEMKGERDAGETQRSALSHAFIDPIVKQPPIVTKFQTVIVFNVVNTSTESDFLYHSWIFMYK